MKPLRPYLYHAYYNWILDNDNTPYLLVNAEYPDVDVPVEFVRDGKIILNIAPRSIGQYVINDESISFNARFQGMLRDIYIPFGATEAIYAQETGDGIMFQDEAYYSEQAYSERVNQQVDREESKPKAKKKPTHLKLVK
ncbi:putative ClpXP protease specificity-enhancing factor [Actinobacillus pleuropneumoniae]|uniref:ClpXP protease specificity-enhancing factor n=1 Tax=Actinobacillus pleuropneumoniae TaxID=715 RepID=UPI000584F250|nr:ClpXP protease specificity-enhancing factor [Actinobacillus pleuropneumoniae]KIE91425.1 putative ClpXP protease specificity-enhancing factor [Actinobacillus pleuropneumoniae]KIE91795.1 putative ClpXP protease specificity-enhancing factor [Actinobacillus pleuropneumoniae]KIE92111.1 putative ClpXP protease specificity-enhancing factor [Actinobacillus pleuropneumoniae]KIE96930.1 putative ClpXP protease specificity-enhancing factor [Actinobacillus pleuropneumoniae]KIE98411.1 putative ClpXP prot